LATNINLKKKNKKKKNEERKEVFTNTAFKPKKKRIHSIQGRR
jgi:hypothetical protein